MNVSEKSCHILDGSFVRFLGSFSAGVKHKMFLTKMYPGPSKGAAGSLRGCQTQGSLKVPKMAFFIKAHI